MARVRSALSVRCFFLRPSCLTSHFSFLTSASAETAVAGARGHARAAGVDAAVVAASAHRATRCAMHVVPDGAMRSASGATDLAIDRSDHVAHTPVDLVDDFPRAPPP